MASDNFVDYVKIHCSSGNGGGGSTHFRREKYIPKGGPDGGDGGRGGHVIVRGNAQLWTLLHLKFKKHIKAGHGAHGSGNLKTGSQGSDEIIEVPLGTVAKDAETGEVLFEITEDGEQQIIQKGGRGGMGNNHFKSATNQTPRYAQPGEEGSEGWRILELKNSGRCWFSWLSECGKKYAFIRYFCSQTRNSRLSVYNIAAKFGYGKLQRYTFICGCGYSWNH